MVARHPPLWDEMAGPEMRWRADTGFGVAKLTEQELPEQRGVAVPVPPTIERDLVRRAASVIPPP